MSAFSELLRTIRILARESPAIIIAIISAIFAVLILTPPFPTNRLPAEFSFYFAATLMSIFVLSVGVEAFVYLQRIRTRERPRGSDGHLAALTSLRNEVDQLKSSLDRISGLDQVDRELIAEKVIASVSDDTLKKVASEWENRYKKGALEDDYRMNIRAVYENIQARLSDEIDSLARRANLNLVIGFSITLIGLLTLGYFAYKATEDMASGLSASDVGIRFAVRASIAIFMQLLSFFFLRLYRYGIFEIKYFQNEITGAQFRIIALEAALKNGEPKTVDKLCMELAKTERNFILKKGETTIALKKDEYERDYDNHLVTLFERAFSIQKNPEKKGS